MFDKIADWLSGAKPESRKLDAYLDKDLGAYCIAPIPLNMKFEVEGLINERAGKKFDDAYIDSLSLAPEARRLYELTLLHFLNFASPLFEQVGKKHPLFPWKLALCFVPNESANAEILLCADEKANTAYVLLNSGTILELLHRMCAVFAVPQFMESIVNVFAGKSFADLEEAKCGFTVDRCGPWLSIFPPAPGSVAMASHCCVMGAVAILCHELAHFYRGHLSYLRIEKNYGRGLREADFGADGDPLEPNVRRLLEMDADTVAGSLASVIWREYDHPAVGPDDAKNEFFYLELIIAIVCVNLVFEEIAPSVRYYSPVWRTQHFLQSFNKDFFYQPPELKEQNRDDEVQLFKLYLAVTNALERAYKMLGWGAGFSFQRFHSETTALLGPDAEALRELTQTLIQYMPHSWHFK